jgi:hypothetical protein
MEQNRNMSLKLTKNTRISVSSGKTNRAKVGLIATVPLNQSISLIAKTEVDRRRKGKTNYQAIGGIEFRHDWLSGKSAKK